MQNTSLLSELPRIFFFNDKNPAFIVQSENMEFSKRLEMLIKREGLSNYGLAKALDIDEGAVRRWIKGQAKPGGGNLLKLAAYFNVSPEWLQSGIGGPGEFRPVKQIPVLGKVPAGFPEQIPNDEIIEYLNLPDAPKGAYALLVKGDSMSPTIQEGDYVLFINNGEYKPGDVLICLNEWGDTMVKRLRVKEGQKVLASDNPKYKPIIPNKHFKIIGKVTDIWSRKKP